MAERRSLIKELLDERGHRYSRFCEALGIQPYTFSRIEGGVIRPPADYYERAAAYFSIPMDLFTLMLAERATSAAEVA